MTEVVVPRASPLRGDDVERSLAAWLAHPRLEAAMLISFAFDGDLDWSIARGSETRLVESLERAAASAEITLITSAEVALAHGRRGDRIRSVFRRLDSAGITVLRHRTLHAKIYIFQADERSCWIVGSTNLSSGGFRENEEVNLRGYHPEDFQGVQAFAKTIAAESEPYWS